MIEDDFYATLKFKNGEEIFAKVSPTEEDERTLLLISHPITIFEIKTPRVGTIGYKVEPWLKTSNEDLFIINMNDILTMSESSDVEMIMLYQQFVRDGDNEKKAKPPMNRKMGYLGTVNDTKEILEKIYKNNNTKSSPDQP